MSIWPRAEQECTLLLLRFRCASNLWEALQGLLSPDFSLEYEPRKRLIMTDARLGWMEHVYLRIQRDYQGRRVKRPMSWLNWACQWSWPWLRRPSRRPSSATPAAPALAGQLSPAVALQFFQVGQQRNAGIFQGRTANIGVGHRQHLLEVPEHLCTARFPLQPVLQGLSEQVAARTKRPPVAGQHQIQLQGDAAAQAVQVVAHVAVGNGHQNGADSAGQVAAQQNFSSSHATGPDAPRRARAYASRPFAETLAVFNLSV